MRHAREGSGGTFFDFNETFLVNLFVINYFKFAILASSAQDELPFHITSLSNFK